MEQFAAYLPPLAQLAEVCAVSIESDDSPGAVWLAGVAQEVAGTLALLRDDGDWPGFTRMLNMSSLFLPLDEAEQWKIYADLQVWRQEAAMPVESQLPVNQAVRKGLAGVVLGVLTWLTTATMHLFEYPTGGYDDGLPPEIDEII